MDGAPMGEPSQELKDVSVEPWRYLGNVANGAGSLRLEKHF